MEVYPGNRMADNIGLQIDFFRVFFFFFFKYYFMNLYIYYGSCVVAHPFVLWGQPEILSLFILSRSRTISTQMKRNSSKYFLKKFLGFCLFIKATSITST